MKPKKLGRFEVVAELGRGAMGVVYKGMDPRIERPVALKTLHFDTLKGEDDGLQARERFLVEARATGQLSHPNILTIYDAGEEGDTAYIAMEFLDGGSLEDKMEEGKFKDYNEIFDIACQVALGLDHAHSKGIVHRDVKPANIMMVEGTIPKIADFGLARFSDSNLTTTGTVLGTPNYMAPEQIRGRRIDGRADLFALGVMLYELLTGEKPFAGDSITAVIYRVVNDDPIPPRQLNMDLPKGIDEFMAKALAKDPADRFQTGREFAEALKALAEGKDFKKYMAPSPGAEVTQKLEAMPGEPGAVKESVKSLASAVSKTTATFVGSAIDMSRERKNLPYIAGAGGLLLIIALLLIFTGGEEKKAPVTAKTEVAEVKKTPAPAEPVKKEAKEEKVPAEPAKKAVEQPPAVTAQPVTKTAEKEKAPEPAKKKEEAKKAQPKPATALLSIRSNPPGAKIFIKGKVRGETPYLNRKYKKKTFEIKITKEGYEDKLLTVKLDRDRTLDVELKKLPEEEKKAEEKVAVEKVEEKKPAVEEKKPEAGFFGSIFKPKEAGNVGTLIVNAEEGDKVTIDGKRYKEFPVVLKDLPIGRHNIFIVRKGKKPFLKTVDLRRNQTMEITPEF